MEKHKFKIMRLVLSCVPFKCVSSSFFVLFVCNAYNSTTATKHEKKTKHIKYCSSTHIFECSNTDTYIYKYMYKKVWYYDWCCCYSECFLGNSATVNFERINRVFVYDFAATHFPPPPLPPTFSTAQFPLDLCPHTAHAICLYVRLSFQMKIASRVHIDSFVDYCSMSSVCVCVRWIRNYILYIIYIDRLIRGSRKYVLYFIKFIFFSQVLIKFFLHHKANFTHKSCPQTYFLLCLINLIHINGKSALKDSRKNTAYMNTMDVYWHSVSTKNSRKHVTMKKEIKCEKVTKNQIDPILWHCHRVHCTQANENYAVTVGASRRVSKWERERLKRKPFSSLIPIIWKFHCTNFIGRMVIRECVLFNIQNIYHIE